MCYYKNNIHKINKCNSGHGLDTILNDVEHLECHKCVD